MAAIVSPVRKILRAPVVPFASPYWRVGGDVDVGGGDVPSWLAGFAPWALAAYGTTGLAAPAYWRAGNEVAVGDILAETRAGSALKLGADGVYQSIPANTPLILGGVGHDVYGAFTALWADGNNPGTFANNAGCIKASTGLTKANLFSPYFVNAAGAYSTTGNAGTVYTGMVAVTVGAPVTLRARYGPGDTGRIRLALGDSATGNVSMVNGVVGNLAVVSANATTSISVVNVVEPDGYTALVTFVPNFTGDAKFCAGPDGTGSGQGVVLWGLDGVAGLVSPPWISNTSPAPTRAASQATIVNYSALGLARPRFKFCKKLDQIGVARTLFECGVDSSNCFGVRITAGNVPQGYAKVAGSEVLTVPGAAIAATGLHTIEFNPVAGAAVLTVDGAASAPGAASYTPPVQTNARFGALDGSAFPNASNMDFAIGQAA